MGMITKSRSHSEVIALIAYRDDTGVTNVTTQGSSGVDEISYESGPKYRDWHCNWKRCFQHHTNSVSGSIVHVEYMNGNPRPWVCTHYIPLRYKPPSISGKLPALSLNDPSVAAAAKAVTDQLDLNASDRVMAYSYVADLVPLLGAFTRASGTLNRIGKAMQRRGRNLRRTPFTTILRDAIQADLVKRFVIDTTIQDTKHILDVWNACTRTWEKAHRRNYEPTVLTGSAVNIVYDKSIQNLRQYSPYNQTMWGYTVNHRARRQVSSTIKAVVDLRYNVESADPVKWIAAKLGISTPLESVWDKIPFSFVVDYFFRVGDAIEYLGDKMTRQDGLRATVARVYSCWLMQKATVGDIYIPDRSTFWHSHHNEIVSLQWGQSFYGEVAFQRVPIAFSDQSGFWDMGGLWSPHLSSVRKRTLLELALQMAT